MHVAQAASVFCAGVILIALACRGREILAWIRSTYIEALFSGERFFHRLLERHGYARGLGYFARTDEINWVYQGPGNDPRKRPVVEVRRRRGVTDIRRLGAIPPAPEPYWDEAEMAAWADSQEGEGGWPHGE